MSALGILLSEHHRNERRSGRPDAKAAGWEGDPAYELFNLGCYIGTAIRVDNKLYGTVFFAREAPREEPFTDSERTFVRLMSQLVCYELASKDDIESFGP